MAATISARPSPLPRRAGTTYLLQIGVERLLRERGPEAQDGETVRLFGQQRGELVGLDELSDAARERVRARRGLAELAVEPVEQLAGLVWGVPDPAAGDPHEGYVRRWWESPKVLGFTALGLVVALSIIFA